MTREPTQVAPPTPPPLAVSARQIADLGIMPISVRGWRQADAAGKVPRAIRFGGKKLWRLGDLEQWVALGCPPRAEFERAARELAT